MLKSSMGGVLIVYLLFSQKEIGGYQPLRVQKVLHDLSPIYIKIQIFHI